MKIAENGTVRDMTEEEEKKYGAYTGNSDFTESEVLALFVKQQINTLLVNDNTALRMKSYYPTWQELVDAEFTSEKAGYKFTYKDDLYKTRNEKFTFQSQWVPGQGTSAIFVQIVESHAGTIEDPIPVPDDVLTNAFEYEIGKHYLEAGKIYICQRKGDEPGKKYSLNYPPSQLVGHYFELIK